MRRRRYQKPKIKNVNGYWISQFRDIRGTKRKVSLGPVKTTRKGDAEERLATILEPIMRVEVVVPEEYMGPVIADLNSRRGQLQGRESRAGSEIINVQVPLAEMFGYATDIRSKTQGRGSFTMHFSHYQQAPPNIADDIVGGSNGSKPRG